MASSPGMLIVDADPLRGHALASLCATWGFPALSLATPQEAVAHAVQRNFRLVLLDAASAVSESPQARAALGQLACPVVLLGNQHERAVAQVIEAVAVAAVVLRPFHAERLKAVIMGLLVAGQPAVRPGLRVLLAEDDPLSQRLIQFLLAQRDHTVTAVGDGETALELCKTQPFDALLLDINLPGINGFAIARQVQATRFPGLRPRLIALTGHGSAMIPQAYAAGMDAFLSKPVDPEILEHVLYGAANYAQATQPQGLLAGLQAALGAGSLELLHTLVNEYLQDAAELIRRMQRAYSGGEFALLQANAHKLASSSDLIGASRIAVLCRQIESGPPTRPEIPEWIAQIAHRYMTLAGELQQMLPYPH